MYQRSECVHFEDIDSYGIIHHPRVLYFFERTRTQYLKERGFHVNALPYGMFLRQITIRYKQPLLMHDEFIIQQKTKLISRCHFTLAYDILRHGRKAVHADIDFVTVDLLTRKMIPIPEDLKKCLTEDLF